MDFSITAFNALDASTSTLSSAQCLHIPPTGPYSGALHSDVSFQANDKNVNDTISGWIFGSFALVQFLTSPLFGKLVRRSLGMSK